MFGIGPVELLLIAAFVLLFVGPAKMPELMKQLGKFFVHARRYSNDVRNEFQEVVRKAEEEIRLEETEKVRALLKEQMEKLDPAIDTQAHSLTETSVSSGDFDHLPEPVPSQESATEPPQDAGGPVAGAAEPSPEKKPET